jgi:hypothetical protein
VAGLLGLSDAVADADAEGDSVELADGLGEPLADGVGDGLGDAVMEGVADGLGEPLGSGCAAELDGMGALEDSATVGTLVHAASRPAHASSAAGTPRRVTPSA